MENSTSARWSEPCYVYWHDTDLNGSISFASIARYLQEAAWHSAESMGFGYNRAKTLGQFWVLVRQHIRMFNFPDWSDNLLIETWPRGVDGFFAFRDYYLKDIQGVTCGGVTSSWMIIDAKTRRPLKPEIVYDILPFTIDELAVGHSAPRIECRDKVEVLGERAVKYSDMDQNGHVNNAKYIEWIFDSLDSEIHRKKFSDLLVNHVSESKIGDDIVIFRHDDPDCLQISICRKRDDRILFTAELR